MLGHYIPFEIVALIAAVSFVLHWFNLCCSDWIPVNHSIYALYICQAMVS